MSARALFVAAALFNFAVGLTFLWGRAVVQPFVQLDPVDGTNVLIMNLAAVLICSLGLMYLLIATDVPRYRPVILVGIAGKLAAVATAASFLWSAGGRHWQAPAIASGDLLFVILFWRAYRTAPGTVSSGTVSSGTVSSGTVS